MGEEMEIKNLETFIMVSETKSFTKAAQRLGFTQSTISFQIKQLEEELGVLLFERINHTVTLTNEGIKFLPISHEMIKLANEAGHIAGNPGNPEGLVRIAIAESLSNWQIGSKFHEFHEKYPNIKVKVVAASTDVMFQMLEQNQVDIVYTLDKKIVNRKYVVAFESPVETHFFARSDNPLTKERSVDVERIISEPLIFTEKDMSYRALLDEELAKRNLEAEPLLEVGDTHLINKLIEQGVGISFLPDFVTEGEVKSGKISPIKSEGIDVVIWRQLIYHKNKWVSPELACVIRDLKME